MAGALTDLRFAIWVAISLTRTSCGMLAEGLPSRGRVFGRAQFSYSELTSATRIGFIR